MSYLGEQQAPVRPQPPGRPSSHIPIWVVLVAVVVLLALAGLAVWMLMPHPDKGPSYPKAWDSRVAPYAKVAEKERGLYFRHPVNVRFLPPAAFEKTVTTDEKDLDDDDREELEQTTGLLRAFGLLRGDVDLFSSLNEAHGAGTLAYYSFEDERITIRGNKVTPAVRATLVHELTHVLQDQHFDLGDRMEKLGKESEKGPSSSEASVLQALGEGDANRIEELYRQGLTARQRKVLDAARQGENAGADKRLKRVPKVLLTMIASPYTLGQGLVQAADADGGNSTVDQLFRKVPTHESSLLDPLGQLDGSLHAKHVDVPALEKGEKKFDSGELGVLTWYFMLAERLPLLESLEAADGWGGDGYVGFTRDGTSCVRAAYRGETSADTNRMYADLRQWIAAAPGSDARASRAGKLVRFESCDPGKAAKVGKDASQDAVDLLTVRASLGVAFLRGGVPLNRAHCLAGRMTQAFPISVLTDPKAGTDPAVKARIQQLAAGCR